MTNRIREFREQRGLTQRDLAALAGRSPAQISRWESGRQGMFLESAGAVARALGVAIEELDLGLGAEVLASVVPASPAVVIVGRLDDG